MLQGEHHPEIGLNKVCILVSEEIMVQVCRWVQALLGTAGEAFSHPWWIIHVDFSVMIVKLLKVGACLVQNVANVIG